MYKSYLKSLLKTSGSHPRGSDDMNQSWRSGICILNKHPDESAAGGPQIFERHWPWKRANPSVWNTGPVISPTPPLTTPPLTCCRSALFLNWLCWFTPSVSLLDGHFAGNVSNSWSAGKTSFKAQFKTSFKAQPLWWVSLNSRFLLHMYLYSSIYN